MAKAQFQSSEQIQVRFPPFMDSTTGQYLSSGTATMNIRKGDGTTQTGVSLSWDAVVSMWYVDLTPTLPTEAGEWRFQAVSSNPNAFPQWKILHVGDYIDKLDAAVSTRATPAQILSDATPFAGASVALIKAKTDLIPTGPATEATSLAIKAKTDLIPATPASQGDVTSAVSSIKGSSSKDLTEVHDDVVGLSSDVGSIQSDVTAVKGKTDLLPADPASETNVLAVKERTDNLPDDPATETTAVAAKDAADAASASALDAKNSSLVSRKIATGRWKIDGTQLFMYDDDGVSVIYTFDLLDNTGAPSNTKIFERRPA